MYVVFAFARQRTGTVHVAQAALRGSGFEEINHSPYSSDLASSNFLLPNLKEALRGNRFFDEELNAATNKHFSNKEQKYFLESIDKLQNTVGTRYE